MDDSGESNREQSVASSFRIDLLANQVAWITGGGSGIGEAVAMRLAEHGADVVLSGRKAERLEAVAEMIRARVAARKGRVWTAPVDVRDPVALEAVVQRIEAEAGRLDLVIAGAAGNFLAPAVTLSANGFGTVIDIDLKGTFHTCKAGFPLLSRSRGSVVALSATLHYTGTPMQVHAVSAKAGIDAMIRTLAVEWGPAGIRVNSVAPGPIAQTPGIDKLAPGGMLDKLARSIPLQRLGTKTDVADTILFLASPAASFISGAVIVVDGAHWLAGGGMASLL